jgi:hypothetical protein
MTTQADPPSEAQQLADARIAIAQGLVRIKEGEDQINALREEVDKLRSALKNVRRIANRGDVNIQPLLASIADVAGAALEKKAK